MPYHFEPVQGLFALSTWDNDIENRFGLVTQDWHAFRRAISDLQKDAQPGEKIKVLYTARHGEAEHNVLAKKYGMTEDAVQQMHPITDPKLTAAGRDQAARLGKVFEREAAAGMPLPTRWFVSPMRRPGETAGLEWKWLFPGKSNGAGDMGHGVPGECVEELREHLHVHHCDERLALRELRPLFPSFTFPSTSPDDDLVWRPKSVRGRETEDEMVARAGKGLGVVMDMANDDDVYISVTAHSGVLRAVYKNLHIPLRRLQTGEMNVLVVRVTEISAPCTCVYHRFVHHLL